METSVDEKAPELAKVFEWVNSLSITDVLRFLGTLFDEDFRRIERWR